MDFIVQKQTKNTDSRKQICNDIHDICIVVGTLMFKFLLTIDETTAETG